MTTKDGIYLIIDGDEWEIVEGEDTLGVYIDGEGPIEDPDAEFCVVIPSRRLIQTSTAFCSASFGLAALKAISISQEDASQAKLARGAGNAKG